MVAVKQKEKIILNLRANGETGVCGRTFLLNYMPTYSQRIGELRREGYIIESETCTLHDHQGTIARYYLRGEPNA